MAEILKEIVQVWCEWDIGQEYQVFASTEAAHAWARQALIDGDFEESYEDLLGDGLVGLTIIEVVW